MATKLLNRLIEYTENDNLIIEIPPIKTPFMHGFLFIWYTFWIYGLYSTIDLLMHLEEFNVATVFIYFWLLVWIYFGVFVGYVFYWHSYGVERITFSDSSLTIQKGIWGRKRHIAFNEIEHIELLEQPTENFPLNPYGGNIVLTYSGKQFIIAKHVNRTDATYIYDLLNELTA